jgi:hypothetical protein
MDNCYPLDLWAMGYSLTTYFMYSISMNSHNFRPLVYSTADPGLNIMIPGS